MDLDSYYGGCPECQGNDGYLNVYKVHWMVCHQHRVKWWIGENLFPCWRDQTASEWMRNKRLLSGYRAVDTIDAYFGE